jgi:predicted DNA binding CopG/RHH family protein
VTERKKSKSKMPIDERLRRRQQLQKAAAKDYAKTEQINFRIDEESVNELIDVANAKGQPLGTLIREWVLERLAEEKSDKKPELKHKAPIVLREIFDKLQNHYGA